MNVLMEFRHVSRYFTGKQILIDINCTIQQGEFVFLSGPSGAGKSTFLKMIALKDSPTEGEILVQGVDLNAISKEESCAYRSNIGFIQQTPQFIPEYTIEDNVALPLRLRGYSYKSALKKARAVLLKVGLLSYAQSFFYQLSGGECQRAEVARAIVTDPAIILADEPTGNLDRNTAMEIMDLLVRMSAEGSTIIFATHDRFLLELYPYRCFSLCKGLIKTKGNTVKWEPSSLHKEELYV